MQEDTAKECSELKTSITTIQSKRTLERSENSGRLDSLSSKAPRDTAASTRSIELLQTALLTEMSITFHLTDSEVIQQMYQHLQLLEIHISSHHLRPLAPETKTRQHKYLRSSSSVPLSNSREEELLVHSPIDPLHDIALSSLRVSGGSQQYFKTKSKWIEATSRFHNILLSVCSTPVSP
jgi:hypothetical protein